jgi:plastocyanin
MERRAFLRAVGPAAAAGLAGCIGGGTAEGDYDVGMSAAAFRPVQIAVEPGTTVRWLNTSKQGHSVTAYEEDLPEGADYFASGGFDDEERAREAWWSADFGGRLESGDRFSHTFEVAGRYDYVCIPHETGGMYATVFVEE